MKVDLYHYRILNFPVDSFVVSNRVSSEESSSSLLSVLHELHECSSISSAEYDELLLAHDLNPRITSYYKE